MRKLRRVQAGRCQWAAACRKPVSNSMIGDHGNKGVGANPANESHRYKVTPSLIGWAQT